MKASVFTLLKLLIYSQYVQILFCDVMSQCPQCHEAVYFLVRLLQEFTGFSLEKSQNVQPPAEWTTCEGLKRTAKKLPSFASHHVYQGIFIFYIWNVWDYDL
jgi:hypothetical protein